MKKHLWVLLIAIPLMANGIDALQDSENGAWKMEYGKRVTFPTHFSPLTSHSFFPAFQSSITNQQSPILVNGWVQGRLSGQWVIQDSLRSYSYQSKALALPGLEWTFLEKGDWTADMEFRLQGSSEYQISDEENESLSNLEIYRGWVRFYSPFTEFRIGYQQLNFGTGRYARVLNWFDNINYFDPQKMTIGVWGARMQIFYRNNANLWLWGLYGNENIQELSWNIQKEKPEWGGRLQIPLLNGEMGFTGNYREIEKNLEKGIERRFGLDGVWDPFVGVWFESSLQNLDISQYDWNDYWLRWNHVTGIDYTFGIGNGLTLSGAWLVNGYKKKSSGLREFPKDWDARHQFGLYATYPISILDHISFSATLSEDSDFVSGGLVWVRSTDDWTIFLSATNLSSRIFTEDLTNRHTINISLQITRYF
jgi:hypothetical protein